MGDNNSGGSSLIPFIISIVIVSYWRYGEVSVLLTSEPWLSPMFYVYVFITMILVSLTLALISVVVTLVIGGTLVGGGLLGYGSYRFLKQSGASIKASIKKFKN